MPFAVTVVLIDLEYNSLRLRGPNTKRSISYNLWPFTNMTLVDHNRSIHLFKQFRLPVQRLTL